MAKFPEIETTGVQTQDIDLVDEKGELVAVVGLTANREVEITMFSPPEKPGGGQGGSTAFVLSDKGLRLMSNLAHSQIVFSFAEDGAPKIELVRRGQVIWTTEKDGE